MLTGTGSQTAVRKELLNQIQTDMRVNIDLEDSEKVLRLEGKDFISIEVINSPGKNWFPLSDNVLEITFSILNFLPNGNGIMPGTPEL
jgi:hypothetical protein